MAEYLSWINTGGQIILLITVIIWMIYFHRMSRPLKCLGVYLALNVVIQITARVLWLNSTNNMPLLHINTVFEFIFISFFFKEIYLDVHVFKKYFIYFLSIVVLLIILNSIFIESIFKFNTNARVFIQLCIIIYVLVYFFDAFGRIDLSQTIPQTISIICFSILLYYAGSFFAFMFGQYSVANGLGNTYRSIWVINGILLDLFELILLYAIIRIAIFKRGKSPIPKYRYDKFD